MTYCNTIVLRESVFLTSFDIHLISARSSGVKGLCTTFYTRADAERVGIDSLLSPLLLDSYSRDDRPSHVEGVGREEWPHSTAWV